MCRVSLISQGTPSLTGAKMWALISIWICSPRQGSFSSCQHSPAHRFQFLRWSIILFYLFAASLPAATVECDPVVVFCLWLQCNLHSVLRVCLFACSLFACCNSGVIVFVSVSVLVWLNAYKTLGYLALNKLWFSCRTLNSLSFIAFS